ncbi:MAG: cryptochrome/photolyase family protein [Endozoicomonas sp.]
MRVIHWFRQDLRLRDNPALIEAARKGEVLPVYILDDKSAGEWAAGAASRWWLHRSLHQLNDSIGGKLVILKGRADHLLPTLARNCQSEAVYWNRCYEPWRIQRDRRIKEALRSQEVEVRSFNGSLLWEPWTVLKADGTPYKVFTPFYRKGCLKSVPPRAPLPQPKKVQWASCSLGETQALSLEALKLLPEAGSESVLMYPGGGHSLQRVDWTEQLTSYWQRDEAGDGIGEESAHRRLQAFIQTGLASYKEGRDYPARQCVSRLSPHLHFGELSPNQVWYETAAAVASEKVESDLDHFHSELGWREFSYYLLFHFPTLPLDNFQRKFDGFPWQNNQERLKTWQRGQAGYPIVDAGMRELWQTGFMHNRVRMIVGSFLIKNLLQDWRQGEEWFWDCLVDADLASNAASWQWVAGAGADAAPYFRIFNPVTQAKKFDLQGDYIRQYVPELANVPLPHLFAPWEAPEALLKESSVVLGKDYPKPIVDLKYSRERALAAWKQLRT